MSEYRISNGASFQKAKTVTPLDVKVWRDGDWIYASAPFDGGTWCQKTQSDGCVHPDAMASGCGVVPVVDGHPLFHVHPVGWTP